jgi:hypothetical protein
VEQEDEEPEFDPEALRPWRKREKAFFTFTPEQSGQEGMASIRMLLKYFWKCFPQSLQSNS